MKKITKAIIIVLILLLILGGASFAYVYFATDILKTDRQLFGKYIAQEAEIFDIFKDDDLKAYNTKKQNTPYENDGKYYVTGIEEYLPEKAKDMNITFSGETDIANKYTYRQIKVNYNDDTSMAIDYVNDKDYYGIKFEEILKKYITIENNNLKEFAEKLGETDLDNIPDKIEIDKVKEQTKFTEEEVQEIKEILKNTLNEKLTDEMFSSNRNTETSIYSIHITLTDTIEVAKTVMQNLSNSELIMNRMKEIYKSQNNASDEEASKYIEELKENVKDYIDEEIDEDYKNIKISINLYVQDKKLIKTELAIFDMEENEQIYNVVLNNEANKISVELQAYDEQELETQASFDIEKTKTEDELKYNISIKTEEDVKIELSAKWTGLNELEKVNEQYSIQMSDDDEEYGYFLTNQNEFTESISNKIDESQLQIVNGYSTEKLEVIIEKLQTAIEQLNKKKMEEIGVDEDANPIIYYIPLAGPMLAGSNDIIDPGFSNDIIDPGFDDAELSQ